MANLKGGSYKKQIKDGLYRLGAFGESRHNSNDHKTHSNKLQEKREMYLKDFASFLESKEIETKLNTAMSKENLKSFMSERLSDLAPKTALDYSAGFNSMLEGLKESNITIKEEANTYLRDLTNQNRQEFKNQDYKKDRYINNLNEKIETLQENRYGSSVIAQIQIETGFRVSEAYEVVKDLKSYLREDNKLVGIVGKGNHTYHDKEISHDLVSKIKNLENLPSYTTYTRDLTGVGIERSHDIRLTFAVNTYSNLLNNGATVSEALFETSKELNHKREEITRYYLKRA